jgi:peroxiredoxin
MVSRLNRVFAKAAVVSFAMLASVVTAQEPGEVRKEIEAFRKDAASKTSSEVLKAVDEGVEGIRKSGVVEKALKVGDKAPDFELPNASGKPVQLSALLENGPVVVTWYRGAWCPFCNNALRGFQKSLPEIKAEGASLIAISPQTPDNSLSTAEKAGLGFEVLSDKGNKAALSFGIAYKLPEVTTELMKGRVDLRKFNGDDSKEPPLGATYVIDRAGVIRYAFVDADYRKRAEPSEVVTALKKLCESR